MIILEGRGGGDNRSYEIFPSLFLLWIKNPMWWQRQYWDKSRNYIKAKGRAGRIQHGRSVSTTGTGRNRRRWNKIRSDLALGSIATLLTLLLLFLECNLDKDGGDDDVQHCPSPSQLGRRIYHPLQYPAMEGHPHNHRRRHRHRGNTLSYPIVCISIRD